jgi:L-lactate dehydrogenase complex protein LldE
MGRRVSLFVTCVVDQLFPKVGLAMAEILERQGCAVDFLPDQTCCAQPAFNSGYHAEARDVARHFLDLYAGAEVTHIVCPSGSCTSMITHHFEDLFRGDEREMERVHAVEQKTWEFSQFLTDVLGVEDVGARYHGVVTYHDSCHALRELKLKSPPRRLLARVQGLTLAEMSAAEECCGFGGTFSVKFAPVSGAMARTKIESIQATGASAVVSIDSSCLMQLRGALAQAGLPVQALHLAEVLNSR